MCTGVCTVQAFYKSCYFAPPHLLALPPVSLLFFHLLFLLFCSSFSSCSYSSFASSLLLALPTLLLLLFLLLLLLFCSSPSSCSSSSCAPLLPLALALLPSCCLVRSISPLTPTVFISLLLFRSAF